MSQERESHNGFEKSATFYLEAAENALISGRSRLAIHLLRAAFEIESAQSGIISAPVLDGLRKAWELACEQGDRSAAESIFGELARYNSSEQNEQAALQLQSLALGQLEDMGVSENDLEQIVGAVSRELLGSDDSEIFDSVKSVLEQLGEQLNETEGLSVNKGAGEVEGSKAIQKAAANQAITPLSGPTKAGLARIGRGLKDFRERNQQRDNEQHRRFDYQSIVGFDSVLEDMRGFGFLAAGDEGYRSFVERSAAMHGVPILSLEGAFLFYGPSREDVTLFAHATAGEIGFPVLHVCVELDEQGNGTIKLAGPFRRGFLGAPPDIMEMQTPCTLLIENIDLLQHMFESEQLAIRRNGGRIMGMMGGNGRSMQAEIMGYLKALYNKPGVFLMATAQHTEKLKDPLRGLLYPMHEIEVAPPQEKERRDVLSNFAVEHPSFAELDVGELAYLTEGISRSHLVYASHSAVEAAYRGSLRSGRYNKVTLGDVLLQLAPYVNHSSKLYQQIENEAVAQLYQDIEQDML